MKFITNAIKYKKAGLILALVLGTAKLQAQQVGNPALDTFTSEPNYHPAVAVDYPFLVNLANTGKYNYEQTITPDVPTQTMGSYLQRVTTEYYDGLGRPLQTVYQKSHADGRDLMVPHVYDGAGRETFQYQPFSPLTGVYNALNPTGKLKLSANSLMRSFYDYQHPDQQPYSQTVFETSALGRVVKQMSPGTSWVGSGRGVTYDYKTNGYIIYNTLSTHALIGAFPQWQISSASDAIPVCVGNYAQGQLFLTVITDEDGKSVIEVKDKLGHLVEKMAARTNSTAVNPDHPGQIRPADYNYTFYVYDDIGNLRFVMPPMAATDSAVSDAWGSIGWSLHPDHVDGYCYSYFYDERNRVIEKKTPGKDIEYFVYDKRDRQVFHQDGNLRQQIGHWLYTVYDALDRPITTGIADWGTNSSISYIQSIINAPPAGITNTDINYYLINYSLPLGTYPPQVIGGCVPLTFTYYDDYDFLETFSPAMGYDYNQFASFSPVANGNIVPPPTDASKMTRGLLTGSKVRVMDPDQPGADIWLKSVNFYDDKGRIVQTQSSNINNISTGKDISSNIYYFQGQLYKNIKHHENPLAQPVAGTTLGAHTSIDVSQSITRNFKISGGNDLVSSITQKIDDGIDYPFENISYDHMGRVVVKSTTAADILNEYNIRGFLNHIDVQNFNNATSIPYMDPQIFEEKIYYDTGFASKLYNGNIAGIKWTMQGQNAEQQAYGYSYDSLNRLSYAAYYKINTGDTRWRTNHSDYTVSNLTYDLNGNIKSMNQRGNLPAVGDMDILTYKYLPNSNQLQNVEDAVPVANTSSLPDFKNNSVSPNGTEYGYDHNGNMTSDANKGTTTTYNIFNKPDKITVANKGVITYVYDGEGNFLQKRVHPTSTGSDEKWDYLDNFIYKNDSLQYILNDEGRARPIAAVTSNGDYDVKYVYDYFVKDHLGNVRSTVTATPFSPQYLAGFELSQANVEQLVFDNVATVRDTKPGSIDPSDHMAARLNADNPATAIGTSIMLKTMPGDRFNISVDALYEGDYRQVNELSGNDIVRSLMTTLTGGANYDGVPVSELPDNVKTIQSIFNNPNLATQIDQLTNAINDVNAPKAHLNYLFFDDKFNLVAGSSGSVQVPAGLSGWNPIAGGVGSSGNNVVYCASCSTPGFLVAYIDNETIGKDVWFDHFMVGHYTSAVVAEDHYYPFGLTISQSEKSGIPHNPYKLTTKELESHFDLNLYDFGARMQDMQLGRWNGVDADADSYYEHSPYNFCLNNPAKNVDLNGKGIWDAIVGFTYAVIDDATTLNFRPYHKPASAEDAKDYNAGQDAGDKTALVAGTAEMNGGADIMDGSVAVTAATGGASIEVTGPGMLLGGGLTLHGAMVVANAAKHLAAKKGTAAETGSYTNDHESGKKYHGKGSEERMNESAKEKEEKYNDPVVKQDWTPAKNDRDAFKQEATRLEKDGTHKNPNNYNKRASPGTKYKMQDAKKAAGAKAAAATAKKKGGG